MVFLDVSPVLLVLAAGVAGIVVQAARKAVRK